MNAKQLIAVAAIALTGAAGFAQEITPDTTTFVASKSREQVNTELLAARKDGTIKAWSVGYIEPVHAVKSREQVRNELAVAKANGEFAAINTETGDFSQGAARLTRVGSAR